MSVPDLDRAQLFAAARSYLEWEAELSGLGPPPCPPGQAKPRAVPVPVPVSAVPMLVPVSAAAAVEAPGRGANQARPSDKRALLAQLDEAVRSCSLCELAKGRTHTVFARGNPDSPVVFVGEGPGQEEDRVGSPFVGAAGQLLDKMIAAMGFARDDVYICNVVKCRPPGNRTPLPVEAAACSPYLLGQLDAIAPRVVVALGRCAAENMGLVEGGGWRGRWGKFRGIDVMPTYHPAFLLRSPEYKRPVWEDLQQVMSKLRALP
ncbi:MAG: Uracil-DNA glycosylase, family 4 [Myxococcaceae bacterium]|nr:Uracil-DNA glycosylase, family 4 [Myxococcaceae bacterium]